MKKKKRCTGWVEKQGRERSRCYRPVDHAGACLFDPDPAARDLWLIRQELRELEERVDELMPGRPGRPEETINDLLNVSCRLHDDEAVLTAVIPNSPGPGLHDAFLALHDVAELAQAFTEIGQQLLDREERKDRS